MAEKQETVHVVMRAKVTRIDAKLSTRTNPVPVKVYDDREDARAYARRMNLWARKYYYRVVSVKKG